MQYYSYLGLRCRKKYFLPFKVPSTSKHKKNPLGRRAALSEIIIPKPVISQALMVSKVYLFN